MRRLVCFLGVLGLVLAACGGGGDGGPGGGTVHAITGPLSSYVPTMFVVTGEGFGAAGSTAQVRFTATDGDTPFDGNSSAVATVAVDVLSDSRAIGVASDAANFEFVATVELLRGDGAVLDGPGVLAWFQPATVNLVVPGDDTLVGDAGPNTLDGGAGNDKLFGGAGNDTLLGGTGNDHLSGEGDNDMLTGGAHADGFHVSPGTDQDVITDIQTGVDRIWIGGTPGGLAAVNAVATVLDSGPGLDVVITWTAGGTVTLHGYGSGSIDDLAALIQSGVAVLVEP